MIHTLAHLHTCTHTHTYIQVFEGYGQTEGAIGATMSVSGDNTYGHVGAPLACNKIKLVDVDDMQYFSNGEGEVRPYATHTTPLPSFYSSLTHTRPLTHSCPHPPSHTRYLTHMSFDILYHHFFIVKIFFSHISLLAHLNHPFSLTSTTFTHPYLPPATSLTPHTPSPRFPPGD